MKMHHNHPCKVFVLGNDDKDIQYPLVLFVIPDNTNQGILRLYDRGRGIVSMNETQRSRSASVDVEMTKKGSNHKLTLTLHPSRPYSLDTMRLIWLELIEFGGYAPNPNHTATDILTESERMAFEGPKIIFASSP